MTKRRLTPNKALLLAGLVLFLLWPVILLLASSLNGVDFAHQLSNGIFLMFSSTPSSEGLARYILPFIGPPLLGSLLILLAAWKNSAA